MGGTQTHGHTHTQGTYATRFVNVSRVSGPQVTRRSRGRPTPPTPPCSKERHIQQAIRVLVVVVAEYSVYVSVMVLCGEPIAFGWIYGGRMRQRWRRFVICLVAVTEESAPVRCGTRYIITHRSRSGRTGRCVRAVMFYIFVRRRRRRPMLWRTCTDNDIDWACNAIVWSDIFEYA